MPILTIIIPTKNRAETAFFVVRNALSIVSKDIEVVVHDCGDDGVLENKLKAETSDERLKYYHSGRPVSMTENWNLAVEKATGEYVTIIGDDDGINPEILEVAYWAMRQGVEVVTSSEPFYYFWPNFPQGAVAAHLMQTRKFAGSVEMTDVEREVIRGSFSFGLDSTRMLNLYHGLVKRELLLKLRDKTGKFCDGFSPDLYIAFALSSVVKKHCIVDYPLTFRGVSGKSNGGRFYKKELYLHWKEYSDLELPELIPQPLNRDATIAESTLKAFINTGRTELIKNTNLPLLYATSLVNDPANSYRLFRQFIKSVKMIDKSLTSAVLRFPLYLILRACRQVALALLGGYAFYLAGWKSIAVNVQDTEEAVSILIQHLNSQGRRLILPENV